MNIKIYFNNTYLEVNQLLAHDAQNEILTGHRTKKDTGNSLKEIIKEFLSGNSSKNFRLDTTNLEDTMKALQKEFIYIEAAGGFIERNGEYLFIYRNGQWDLPKGKLEKKETTQDCAIRECEEECGIKGLSIERPLHSTYHVYAYRGGFALKRSYWYYMRTDYNKQLVPQLEENITEVRWFNSRQVADTVMPHTYHTIRDVVTQALHIS